jgi:hypothetical protein
MPWTNNRKSCNAKRTGGKKKVEKKNIDRLERPSRNSGGLQKSAHIHCRIQHCRRQKKQIKKKKKKKKNNASLTLEAEGETVGVVGLGFGDDVSTSAIAPTFGEAVVRLGEVGGAGS